MEDPQKSQLGDDSTKIVMFWSLDVALPTSCTHVGLAHSRLILVGGVPEEEEELTGRSR